MSTTRAPRYFTERPSQRVRETIDVTPNGHATITLERTSTGGHQYQQKMKRKMGTAMSGAERAEKKRKRALLFPDKAAALRKKDAERKQKDTAQSQKVGDAEEAVRQLSGDPCECQKLFALTEEQDDALDENDDPPWKTICCGAYTQIHILEPDMAIALSNQGGEHGPAKGGGGPATHADDAYTYGRCPGCGCGFTPPEWNRAHGRGFAWSKWTIGKEPPPGLGMAWFMMGYVAGSWGALLLNRADVSTFELSATLVDER